MRQTEQEAFWEGNFGDEYCDRNRDAHLIPPSITLFADIFRQTSGVTSILELGANMGLNLRAIRALRPNAELAAVEINRKAADELQKLPGVDVYVESILEFEPTRQWDLVFTKGVLIHIAPEYLERVYDLMWRASRRYILLVEYYNPDPVEVVYRGHEGKLFKRDFAGDVLGRWPQLRLVNYGFRYRRDPEFPLDDLTWFLLEKQ